MDERLCKLQKLREKGINPYPYEFKRTHTFMELRATYETLSSQQEKVTSCGRIMTIRGHGKTMFMTLADENAGMQVYLRQDKLGDIYDICQFFDIGDILGVTGVMFKTKTGELTILVEAIQLLAKALRPLPEKWHGLTDVEIRYRKRFLDLIVNKNVRDFFKKRAQLISTMRTFFDKHGFLETETPVLQPIYGGGTATPFKTYYAALDQEMYLRIADELYLKRLIVGGYEKVYEFCRDFRNEGLDRFHNPEFTMVEAYQAYTDYHGIMELVESLFEYILDTVIGSRSVAFGEETVEFKRPIKRIKYVDALNAHLDFDVLSARDDLLTKACQDHGIDPSALSIGAKIDKLFGALVQDALVEPTFIMDYPKVISPLAKVHRADDRLVERFELVMFGIELANAFSELNDPVDQRKRFEEQLANREEGISEIDEDFLEALEHGMPPTGGLGIGIDRLCMVFFNQPSIRDVLLFPQLKKVQNVTNT
ncbi:lysine--tRNA ligase [candidate division WOR-3 bacterium]|nr:lysine--tRNA ligase [candidate division WOR-3 bacterium]